MPPYLIVLIGTQVLFSTSDVLARHYMPALGFRAATFMSWWFVIYMSLRTVATFGQLYVFTQLELGRTMTLFAIVGLVMANLLGLFILKEQISLQVYLGVVLVIIAFFIVGFAKQS